LIKAWLDHDAGPPKLVYLLEHDYSPAGLSFSGLKNADAALVSVLSQAAQRAGCAVHLGIVHIEESGAAELPYVPYHRRSKWRRYDDEEYGREFESQDFEVIEVFDADRYVSDWVDLDDHAVAFGKIPLGEAELLPAGALDNEPPDQQRVSEATGNEGASFERSYHRAAIVIWGQDNYPNVLLQAGVGGMIPYLSKCVEECLSLPKAKRTEAWQKTLSSVELVIESWENAAQHYGDYSLDEEEQKNRSAMLRVLLKIKDARLLQRFIEQVVAKHYEGHEKSQLIRSFQWLEPKIAGLAASNLLEHNLKRSCQACVDLLAALVDKSASSPERLAAWHAAAGALVKGLSAIQLGEDDGRDEDEYGDVWWAPPERKPMDPSVVEDLFRALQRLGSPKLAEEAAGIMMARPKTWIPDTLLVPALTALHHQDRQALVADPAFPALWRHSADYLIGRSGMPPAAPTDWAQPVKIKCGCGDCVELERFAGDPAAQVHRFRVAKHRRQHLHGTINRLGLDMTHETERIGSPHTLVCTKTRRSYEKRCHQYRSDIEQLKTLAKLGRDLPDPFEDLREKVENAIDLAGRWKE
jgi:hypothetical protein